MVNSLMGLSLPNQRYAPHTSRLHLRFCKILLVHRDLSPFSSRSITKPEAF
jgi:hypothetical protein